MSHWQQNYSELTQWLQAGDGQVIWQHELAHIKAYCAELGWKSGAVFADANFPLDKVTNKVCLLVNMLGAELEDELHLGINNESVDLIVISHVLACMDDPAPFLKEIKRILRPGGYVLITGLRRWSWLRLAQSQQVSDWLVNGALQKELHKMGLWVRQRQRFSCFPLARIRFFQRFYCPLLANAFILVAQKYEQRPLGLRILNRLRAWYAPAPNVASPSTRVRHGKG